MRSKILLLASGPIAGQVLAFSALPIITRLYAPEQLGSFQVMLVFCNTLGAISALSIERALLLNVGSLYRATIRRLAIVVTLGVAASSAPLYLIFHHIIPTAPLTVWGVPVVLFVVLSVLFRGLFLVEYTMSIAEGFVRAASLSIFTKDVARIAVRIGLGLTILNPLGLFIAVVLDWGVGTAILWKKKAKHNIQWRKIIAIARRYKEYPLFYAPAVALTTLTAQAPVLLLGSFYPVREAGLYSLAFLLLDRPSRLVSKAAGDILAQRLASSAEPTGGAAIVSKAGLLSFLCLLSLMTISTITWAMAETILGSDWGGVGVLAFACIPHALALFISDMSIGLFAAASRIRPGLYRQVGSLCIVCLSFGLAYAFNFSVSGPIFTAGLAHLTMQATFLIYLSTQMKINKARK